MSLARIRKDDTVFVRSGKDKGKTGRVLRVWHDLGRVLVEGLNKVKRHSKPGPGQNSGKIDEREAPLSLSVVALVHPETNKPTRMKTKVNEDRSKNRVTVKGGKVIEAQGA